MDRGPLLPFLAGATVVALLATSVTAVAQSRRAAQEAERADRLEARVSALETEVDRLEDELERAAAGGELGRLLEGLLGGDDLGGLGDLFGGLFGDGPDGLGGLDGLGDLDGLFDGLFGTGGIPGAACFTPDLDGGLLDGLGGLFGRSPPAQDPDEVVATVTAQVEQLRELELERDVEVAFLDDDAIAAELDELVDEQLDPDELASRTAALVALRAVTPDTDLERVQRDLLDEQVAGYYVPEDERLVVRSPDDGRISALDRVVLAHELDHAIADQALGLPDLADGLDADAALARLSVIEGDATLLMNLWALQHLSLTEQLSMVGIGDLVAQQEALDEIPHHLQRELLFPYTAGLDLICDRWLEGGWAAVDAAYDDLPATSAGVLWPERYAEPPAEVPTLRAPADASASTTDTFGAAELLWLLEAPGGDADRALDDPLTRASAWAGGQITVWDTDAGPVVGLALRDRGDDAPALCGTVTGWVTAAYATTATRAGDLEVVTDDDGVAVVRCEGDTVRVGFAASPATATAVVR